jgi:hypothetical protein
MAIATENIYQQNGFKDRKDYLGSLREDYGGLVDILTSVLPEEEDFDGLVTELNDALDSGQYEDLV